MKIRHSVSEGEETMTCKDMTEAMVEAGVECSNYPWGL